MNTIISILVGCLISTSAFASGISISPLPLSPIVLTSNSGSAPAPWFSNSYQISTDQLITVVGIQTIVTAKDGRTQATYFNFANPIEISAGTSYRTASQSFGNLPAQNGFAYQVDAHLIGWVGAASTPGAKLNTLTTFVTQ